MKIKLIETKPPRSSTRQYRYPWTLWIDEKRIGDFQCLQVALEMLENEHHVLLNDLQIDINNLQTILQLKSKEVRS